MGLVGRQEALAEDLELHTEIVDVFDCLSGQPLSCCQVFDQHCLVDRYILSNGVESLFGVDLFDHPKGVRVEVGSH